MDEGKTLTFNCYNNEHQSSKLKWCDNEDCNAKPNFDAVRRRATRCDVVRRCLCYGDEKTDIQC